MCIRDSDYTDVLEEISKSGGVSFETRKNLAYKAFSYVANYDSQISSWLLEKNSTEQFPKYFPIPLKIKNDLDNLPNSAAFFSEKDEVINDNYKLKDKEFISNGEKIVITGGVPVGGPGTTNYLSVMKLD